MAMPKTAGYIIQDASGAALALIKGGPLNTCLGPATLFRNRRRAQAVIDKERLLSSNPVRADYIAGWTITRLMAE